MYHRNWCNSWNVSLSTWLLKGYIELVEIKPDVNQVNHQSISWIWNLKSVQISHFRISFDPIQVWNHGVVKQNLFWNKESWQKNLLQNLFWKLFFVIKIQFTKMKSIDFLTNFLILNKIKLKIYDLHLRIPAQDHSLLCEKFFQWRHEFRECISFWKFVKVILLFFSDLHEVDEIIHRIVFNHLIWEIIETNLSCL